MRIRARMSSHLQVEERLLWWQAQDQRRSKWITVQNTVMSAHVIRNCYCVRLLDTDLSLTNKDLLKEITIFNIGNARNFFLTKWYDIILTQCSITSLYVIAIFTTNVILLLLIHLRTKLERILCKHNNIENDFGYITKL